MSKLKYSQVKPKAIELRRKGWSYREIGKELGVSKNTIKYWCASVPLNPEDRKRLYTKQILMMSGGPSSQKARRIREISKIINEAGEEVQIPLSFETYRFFGAALYWAEGSKTNHFSVTNSDPHFILFMVQWFEKIFGILRRDMKANLNIYPQQDDQEIKQFWSQLIGIPLENFGKSFVKPPNKGYKKNNLYYGTIRIKIPKGTDMRHRVFGWIKAALKDIEPKIGLVQKEWKSLKEIPRPVNIPKDIELPR